MSDENEQGFDAGDPAQVHKQKKKATIVQQHINNDLQKVLGTPEGRRVMFHMLDMTSYMATNLFTGNSRTFYNLGKRDIGVKIIGWVAEVNPSLAASMMVKTLDDEVQFDVSGANNENEGTQT